MALEARSRLRWNRRWRNAGVIFVFAFAFTTYADARIGPSFWLSRCAWDATDVIELAITPDEGRFRVVANMKGSAEPGSILTLPELAPSLNDHSLLRDLARCAPGFDLSGC